jgi:hypothetical protein
VGKGHAAAGFSAGRAPGAAAVEGLAAAAGFAAGFAFAAFFAGFLAAFFAAFFFAGFFAAFFAAFFTAFFAAFLAGFFAAFLAAGFFAAFFAAGFFAAAFFTAGFLAAGFFAAGFFAVAMIFLLHEESKKLPTKKPVCTSPDYSSAQAIETFLALMNALPAARERAVLPAGGGSPKKNAGACATPGVFSGGNAAVSIGFRSAEFSGGRIPLRSLAGALANAASLKFLLCPSIHSLWWR